MGNTVEMAGGDMYRQELGLFLPFGSLVNLLYSSGLIVQTFHSIFFFAYSSIFAMQGLPTYVINVLIVTLLPGSVGLGL